MLAKFKPLLNADDVPCTDDWGKIGCVKAEELEELKGGVVLTENPVVEPNKEVADDDVEPKGLDAVVVPKGEEPPPNVEVGVVPKPLLNAGVF